MAKVQRFSLMMFIVLVFAMPVYTQDSKESKGNASKSDRAESKDKAEPKDKASNERAAAGGAKQDREPRERGCGGIGKP
ncbi:MAG TPA: hypothetical protein VN843_04825 [Anaerolineales bacterium]|nr:hypothetical protein [Anaerolineales bacterium]